MLLWLLNVKRIRGSLALTMTKNVSADKCCVYYKIVLYWDDVVSGSFSFSGVYAHLPLPSDPGEGAVRAHLQERNECSVCGHRKAPGGGFEK